jgi:hypothetical protein
VVDADAGEPGLGEQQLLQPLALATAEVDGSPPCGRPQPADQLAQSLGRYRCGDRMTLVGDVEDLGPVHVDGP